MTTLNHRINIEQRSSSTDALGQPLETWTLVAAVWADVRHLSGTATLKAGADASLVQASIRIRQRSGLNAGLRVVHGSDLYDIRAVLPDGKNQYIDLVCQRVA
ncbi:MAG: phage head closure protein [Mizugakiibacter sp.]|uniref:phage head closure protein n=1 Tax=Mizugakiibacter sp. TaxID=1972610 RepID=UPI00320D5FFD